MVCSYLQWTDAREGVRCSTHCDAKRHVPWLWLDSPEVVRCIDIASGPRIKAELAGVLVANCSQERAAKLTGGGTPGVSLVASAQALVGASRPGVLSADLAACNAYGDAEAGNSSYPYGVPDYVIGTDHLYQAANYTATDDGYVDAGWQEAASDLPVTEPASYTPATYQTANYDAVVRYPSQDGTWRNSSASIISSLHSLFRQDIYIYIVESWFRLKATVITTILVFGLGLT